MSFISTGGVSKWSQVTIDADKDMLTFGLENLKEVVAGMAAGDIIYFLGGQLQKLTPLAADVGKLLATKGPGLAPDWNWPDTFS